MAVKKLYLNFPLQTAIPVLGVGDWETDLDILEVTGASSPFKWYEACAVDVSFDGTWEEEDTTDSCSNEVNEAAPTTRNSEISFDHFFKLNSSSAVPAWISKLKTAWQNKDVIMVMMLNDALSHATYVDDTVGDGPTASTLYDGIVMAANIFGYNRTHPTKGAIKIEYTLKAAGTVQLASKMRFISHTSSA